MWLSKILRVLLTVRQAKSGRLMVCGQCGRREVGYNEEREDTESEGKSNDRLNVKRKTKVAVTIYSFAVWKKKKVNRTARFYVCV